MGVELPEEQKEVLRLLLMSEEESEFDRLLMKEEARELVEGVCGIEKRLCASKGELKLMSSVEDGQSTRWLIHSTLSPMHATRPAWSSSSVFAFRKMTCWQTG